MRILRTTDPAGGASVPIRAILIVVSLILAGLAIRPASAQEPLFLRIRPSEAEPRELGANGPGPSDLEIARAARAAREAVWERSAVRARIAIASVCTGCLKPMPPMRADRPPEGTPAALPQAAAAARATEPTTPRGTP